MKSYFAKLATRATLPNASPAPSRAVPMVDPFENVSTPGTPAVTENVSLSEGPKTQLSEARRPRPAVNTEEIGQSFSRRRDREVKFESDSDAQPVMPRTAEPRHDVPERVRQTERPHEETPKQSPVLKLEPNQSARPTVKQDETPDSAESSTIPAEPREAMERIRTDHAVDETNTEQTISLKKADEFMRALFAQRTTPRAAESNREKEERAPVVQAVAARESTSRLQPAAKPRQPPEPPPEQPSLVIGKLTVEVVPPPSPPVTPRREVVVLRAAPNSRPAAIHSSQRFGLGQF